MLALWAGFAIGLAFGAVGQITGFCLNRGLREVWARSEAEGAGAGLQLRAFAVALAVAMIASQGLEAAGILRLGGALALAPGQSAVALLFGGILFGYGMIAANGCGARALVLLGQGNLRSLVVLIALGLAAAMTLTGVLAPIRAFLIQLAPMPAGMPVSLPLLLGVLPGEALSRLLPSLALGGLLLAFAYTHQAFRRSLGLQIGGILIGLLIPAGWLATGLLGDDPFDPLPLASLSFVAPISETIHYAMIATGMTATFGIAVVCGVFLGSLVAALLRSSFKLEGFPTPQRLLRSLAGGALMGIGGALALGCSIGQGLTGLSTLALGSFLAAFGILAGGWLALRGPLRLPPL